MTLTKRLKRAASGALSLVRPEATVHDGVLIPARHLRFGGRYFQADADFVSSARREADRLVAKCGLTKEGSVLDIGCGPGRLPIGILDRVGEIKDYLGVDVSRTPIRWCKRHIASRHPSFRFLHIDVENPRYNRSGSMRQEEFRLPIDADSADVIYLYSVFSHLLPADIEPYLAEFSRVLKRTGKVFLTAFVEDGVPDVSENPEDYGDGEWKGPLHCVRFESGYFRDLLDRHGFLIDAVEHGVETDGQSGFYLSPLVRG